MEKNQSMRARYPRYLLEFLFSLNVALVGRWTEVRQPFRGFYYWDVLEYRLEFAIEKLVYNYSHPNTRFVPKDVEGHTAFLLLTLVTALCIFLIFRLASRTFWAKEFLRSVAGIVSLVAVPAFWLNITRVYPQPPELPNPGRAWLFLELTLAIAAAVSYLLGKWSLPGWVGAVLIISHHVFWAWLFLGGVYFWYSPFEFLIPASGLFASLAWVLFVKKPPMLPSHSTL